MPDHGSVSVLGEQGEDAFGGEFVVAVWTYQDLADANTRFAGGRSNGRNQVTETVIGDQQIACRAKARFHSLDARGMCW